MMGSHVAGVSLYIQIIMNIDAIGKVDGAAWTDLIRLENSAHPGNEAIQRNVLCFDTRLLDAKINLVTVESLPQS